jgi:transcription initiation factor IIE alpha subunit
MIAKFNGMCWVCKDKHAIYVDHDHKTGKARGAVCPGCNTKLAAMDKTGWIAMAMDYLAEFG